MVMSDDKTPSVYAQVTSRIDKVKVYAAGATVTRVADLQLGAGEIPEHVEMAGLPLALDDSSVRVRVEAELDVSTAIATDVRIGLAVPPRQAVQNSPTDEEVREAKAEVQRMEDAIALIDNEIAILYQLDVPERPDGEEGKAPPPSPLTARLALTNFKDEQVRARIQEKRETKEKLRQAREHLDNLLQKQARASSARKSCSATATTPIPRPPPSARSMATRTPPAATTAARPSWCACRWPTSAPRSSRPT